MPVKNRLISSAAYEGMADQESNIVNGRKITEYYKAKYKAVSTLNKSLLTAFIMMNKGLLVYLSHFSGSEASCCS